MWFMHNTTGDIFLMLIIEGLETDLLFNVGEEGPLETYTPGRFTLYNPDVKLNEGSVATMAEEFSFIGML